MIEHRILTQEDIDTFPYHGKDQVGPWCRLCSEHRIIKKSGGGWSPRYIPKMNRYWHKAIQLGEKIVKVTFRNKAIAYYHESCWNNPDNAKAVERIKSRAV